MKTCPFMPFVYTDAEYASGEQAQYENATFTADWGPFKKHQVVEFLSVDTDACKVQTWDRAGHMLEEVRIKVVPVG